MMCVKIHEDSTLSKGLPKKDFCYVLNFVKNILAYKKTINQNIAS